MLPPPSALANSVVSFPPKESVGPGPLVFDVVRGPLLPPRGTKERDRILRVFDQNDFASNWQGATSGILKKASQTRIQFSGPPSKVQYYQDLVGTAHFGHGWEYLVKLGGRDYLTQSYGWIMEIAGPGDPSEPLIEAPTGINHLDAGRCYVTGNPTYPILYYSLWDGKLHKMHASRVYMIVDDPNPDERYFGIGRCALERAIAIAQREVRMGQYIDSLLDDRPQPGILSLTGVAENNWTQKVAQYMTQQQNDERPVFGRTIVLTSLDPNAAVKAEVIPFAQTPEKFDWIKYMDADLSNYALAIGVDRQELAELTGKALGSGAQSETLSSKSSGKFYGDFYAQLSRFLNWAILPDDCEATVVEDDSQEKAAQAAIDTQYSQIAASLTSTGVPVELVMKMLAQVSPTFETAFTDERGNIVLPKQEAQSQIAAQTGVDNTTPMPDGTSAAIEQPMVGTETPVAKAYNSSQPRARDGEWTSGGAGGIGAALQAQADSMNQARNSGGRSKPKPEGDDKKPAKREPAHAAAPKPENKPDVEHSARAYTAGAYHPINEHLRGKRANLSPENKRIVHDLDNAIEHSKLTENTTLFRGQVMTPSEAAALKPGSVIHDKGYMSTSGSMATANAYTWATTSRKSAPVITKIRAPQGTSALPVSKYSRAESENEVLLPRGSSLKIVSSEKRNGTYFLEAEIVSAPVKSKAYGSTSSDFQTRFVDIVTRAVQGRLRRNQAENLMLGLLNSSGIKAFQDGLIEGGVAGDLDDDDLMRVQDWLSDTIDYLDPFITSAFDGTLPEAQVDGRAQMWTNKSLGQMHTAGRLSADKNGMYLFTGKDGKENCTTCKRLKGQVHRFKDWERKKLIPGLNTDTFDCGGWRCEHRLVRTTGKAYGGF
jgi:hypothetical protein